MAGLGCCTSAMDSDDEWDNDYQFGADYVNDQVSPPSVQDSSLPPPRNSAEVPLPDIPQDSRQSFDFQNFLDGEDAVDTMDGVGGIAAKRNSQSREQFTLGDIKQRFRGSGHGRRSTSGQAPQAQELPNYENVPRQGMPVAEPEALQSLPVSQAPQRLSMSEAPQSLPSLPSYENVPRQVAPTKDRKSKKKSVQISAPPDKPVDVSGVPLVPPIPAYPASANQAPGSTSADPSALRSVSYSVPVATTVSPTPTAAAPPVASNAFAAFNGLPPLAPVIPAYPPAPTPAPVATSSNTRNVVIPAAAAVAPVAPPPALVAPPAASNPHAPYVPACSTAPGPSSYSVPVVTSPSQTLAPTVGTPSITAPLVSETMTSFAPPQPPQPTFPTQPPQPVAAPPPPPPPQPPAAPAPPPPPPPVVPAPAPAPPPPPPPAPPVQAPVPTPQPPPPQFEPPRPAPPPAAPPAPVPAPTRPLQQNGYRGPFTETIDLQLPTDQLATFPRDNHIRGRPLDDEGWSTVSRVKVG